MTELSIYFFNNIFRRRADETNLRTRELRHREPPRCASGARECAVPRVGRRRDAARARRRVPRPARQEGMRRQCVQRDKRSARFGEYNSSLKQKNLEHRMTEYFTNFIINIII